LKIDTGVDETTIKGALDHGLVKGVVGNRRKRRRGRRGSFGVVRNSVVIGEYVAVEVVVHAGRWRRIGTFTRVVACGRGTDTRRLATRLLAASG
jgi:hypothetical protein